MLFVPAALSQENPMKLLFSCKASGSALHLDFSHHAPETFFFVSDQCRVCFILPYHQGTKRKAHTSISQYCAKFPPLSFLLFFLDPSEFALRDIQLGASHAYLIAAEKVAIRLDVVSGLKKDLAEFQGDGIWRDRTSFKAVSRSSASRFCDSTVSLKTDFNVWISSSLYSGRTVTPSSFASTFCFSWLHFAVCAPCFSTRISPPLSVIPSPASHHQILRTRLPFAQNQMKQREAIFHSSCMEVALAFNLAVETYNLHIFFSVFHLKD